MCGTATISRWIRGVSLVVLTLLMLFGCRSGATLEPASESGPASTGLPRRDPPRVFAVDGDFTEPVTSGPWTDVWIPRPTDRGLDETERDGPFMVSRNLPPNDPAALVSVRDVRTGESWVRACSDMSRSRGPFEVSQGSLYAVDIGALVEIDLATGFETRRATVIDFEDLVFDGVIEPASAVVANSRFIFVTHDRLGRVARVDRESWSIESFDVPNCHLANVAVDEDHFFTTEAGPRRWFCGFGSRADRDEFDSALERLQPLFMVLLDRDGRPVPHVGVRFSSTIGAGSSYDQTDDLGRVSVPRVARDPEAHFTHATIELLRVDPRGNLSVEEVSRRLGPSPEHLEWGIDPEPVTATLRFIVEEGDDPPPFVDLMFSWQGTPEARPVRSFHRVTVAANEVRAHGEWPGQGRGQLLAVAPDGRASLTTLDFPVDDASPIELSLEPPLAVEEIQLVDPLGRAVVEPRIWLGPLPRQLEHAYLDRPWKGTWDARWWSILGFSALGSLEDSASGERTSGRFRLRRYAWLDRLGCTVIGGTGVARLDATEWPSVVTLSPERCVRGRYLGDDAFRPQVVVTLEDGTRYDHPLDRRREFCVPVDATSPLRSVEIVTPSQRIPVASPRLGDYLEVGP